jgi:hypothetical protein
MRGSREAADAASMKKRALAAVLWFFAGWYGGALIAMFTGASPYLGPVLGTVAAALVAGDPFGWIWIRSPRRDPSPQVVSTSVHDPLQTTP